MKRVITYGTYDLMHHGHINLLKNAKKLGDFLIVGITSDEFDKSRGKIDVRQSLSERLLAVQQTGLADMIIVEEYEGQKIADIQKYDVDIFTVGSDWVGKFDYLKEFCDVVYLPRTEGVSSTMIRSESTHKVDIGVIGHFNPAERFILDGRDTSGVSINGIYSADEERATSIARTCEIERYNTVDELFENNTAVYIADRIDRRLDHIESALQHGKHVICEGPLGTQADRARECFEYAEKNGLVLFDALKTRHFPGYRHLVLLVKSGRIGEIKDLTISFSQNIDNVDYSSMDKYQGSLYDLGGYVFFPIIQFLGRNPEEIHLYSTRKKDFDILTEGILKYETAVATLKAGIGIKTEGQLIITGTDGYIYVPAPWWKTDYFEIRYEDLRNTKKYFWKYEGEGFRYELMDFVRNVNNNISENQYFGKEDSLAVVRFIEEFDKGKYKIF